MDQAALAGVQVVEVGAGIALRCAGMLLGDYGAHVTRIRLPEVPGVTGDRGAPMWDRNKLLVDGAQVSADEWRSLLETADVVLRNDLVTGDPDPFQIDAEEYPRLVVCDMPPYIPEDDWPVATDSYEFLGALGAVARRQSSWDGGPVENVSPFVLYEQGLWAATVIVAALVEGTQSGQGQVCRVDGMHGTLIATAATAVIPDGDVTTSTAVGPAGPQPNYSPYRCADDQWIFFAALTPKFLVDALPAIGVGHVIDDPRVEADFARFYLPEVRDWVRSEIAKAFLTRPRDEWLELLEGIGCPCGPLGARDAWLNHPQLEALGLRYVLDDPEVGQVAMPGPPVEMSLTPARMPVPRRSGPLAPPAQRADRPLGKAAGARDGGPLAGTRVLDLGTVLAGPYAGVLLAELGADVIKVEPLTGDAFRTTGFHYNRGQRSLAVDLQDPRGRAAFLAVVETSDAVIDNFRPGVLGRLGIDHDSLCAVNPGIITMSISGFGDRGPYGGRPGFDPVLQAMSGMMTAQGGGSDPVFLTLAANDVTAACASAFGVCLALASRARSGIGQNVQTSLAAVSAFMQAEEIVEYESLAPARSGSRDHPGPAPWDRYYATADGFLRVRVHELDGLEHLAKAFGAPLAGWHDLETKLAAITTSTAHAALRQAGIVAAPGRTQAELATTPAFVAGKYLARSHDAQGDAYYLPERLARFSRTERSDTLTSPGLGEHSDEVLLEAGLSPDQVQALLADSVIVQGGPLAAFTAVRYR